ncbi:MAG TPA: SDR family oxidoreductase [Candidatus Sulfotelmatobacter sp.]|nr:SDR family oxidoreductase [Candidatus Sulfotelmatobacter sp.]
MKRFEGKSAVITGGNSGIGLATAKQFHDEGAKVAISGRDQKTLDAAVKTIGPETLAVRADVAKLADLDQFFAQVAAKFGKIDALFANAGIAKFSPAATSSEQMFDETFDINVKGLFFTLQKAIPLLNDNAGIVLNSSVVNSKGNPATSVYSASKAAVRSLARTLAAELVGRGIRVNVVSPGPIYTPILEKGGMPQAGVDNFVELVKTRVPMKRLGTPEEVAHAVLFLASSEASYITGVDLNVDGGLGQI